MPFADSSFIYEEAGPLDFAELDQLESMTRSMPQPELEDLKPIKTQHFIPSESALAISTTSIQPKNTTTSQKRQLLGPSRHYELPRKKKRGIADGMTKAEQGKRTKKGNACITCRKRGKKVRNSAIIHYPAMNFEQKN